MLTAIIRFFLNIWLKVPFGYICRVHHNDSHMTLRKDYWIVVSRGKATDMLPITFVSHHLQNEFALRMKAIGYDVDAYFDKNAHAQVSPASDININIRDLTTRSPRLTEESSVATAEEYKS